MTEDNSVLAAKRALAEKFTSAIRHNPNFDRKRDRAWWAAGHDDEEPSNSREIVVPVEERMDESLMVVFTASDGYASLRPVTIPEVVQVLAEAGLLRDAPGSTSTERIS